MNNDTRLQQIYADPWNDSTERQDALQQDPELGALQACLRATDERLRIPAPDALRVALLDLPAQEASNKSRFSRLAPANWPWQRLMPMAASLLFALSLSLYYWPVSEEGMRRDILRHMYSELLMLETDKDIDLSMLNQHMHAFGAHLEAAGSDIDFDIDVMDLKDCRVAHEHSLHLVLNTPEGPVTVFLMGNNPIQEEYEINDGRFSGLITPTPRGNLAILSDTEHQAGVYQVKHLLDNNMVW